MPNYKVKHTSILHNGKVHAEGSTIALTEEEAKRLFDFVELLREQKQSETKTVKKETPKEAETQTVENNTTEPKTKKSVKAKTPQKNETENSSDTTKTEGDK